MADVGVAYGRLSRSSVDLEPAWQQPCFSTNVLATRAIFYRGVKYHRLAAEVIFFSRPNPENASYLLLDPPEFGMYSNFPALAVEPNRKKLQEKMRAHTRAVIAGDPQMIDGIRDMEHIIHQVR